MAKNGFSSVLEAAAMSGGCCNLRNADGSCCMTVRALEIFQAIEAAGGPTLEQIEAIANGSMVCALAAGDGTS